MQPHDNTEIAILEGLSLSRSGLALEQLAARCVLPALDAEDALARCRSQGWAEPRVHGSNAWVATKDGVEAFHARVRVELSEHQARSRVLEGYRGFRRLNDRMLEICTAWQLRRFDDQTALNDHANQVYDGGLIAELTDIDRRLRPSLDTLASVAERFGRYRDRFDRARARVLNGDVAWVTGVTVDSFHSIWFELHENLLVTLGTSREEEAQAGGML